MSLSEVQKLLDSKVHEHRLAAAIILSEQFARADDEKRHYIYEMYLRNVADYKINNWGPDMYMMQKVFQRVLQQ